MTGGDGFLGWHTRCAAKETGTAVEDIPVGDGFNPGQARDSLQGASRLIHFAGVNRGTDSEIADGNRLFAEQAASALRCCGEPPAVVVYANSIQADLNNQYGRAKLTASQILAKVAADVGSEFIDVKLPNVFGEHGRPFYNSVVATFCHQIAQGEHPEILEDRELTLIHAQDVADIMIGTVPPDALEALVSQVTVTDLLSGITEIADIYRRGEIPSVETAFARNLFNTYRSFIAQSAAAQDVVPLEKHADQRGTFFEVIRTHGGQGQTSFSTTVPGITRGNHFHRRKVERFVVLAGKARISLRRCLSDQTLTYDVEGTSPVAVDMPTLWTHNITSTGPDPLYTLFWTNDLFDPTHPDTIAEEVGAV